jgi:hypothetical protein
LKTFENKAEMIKKSNLLQFIVEVSREEEFKFSSGNEIRRAYKNTLIVFANTLEDLRKTQEDVDEVINGKI